MIATFKFNDFNIGDPYNPPHNTLFFATSKSKSFSKENYAIKKLEFYDPGSFKTNEDNLKSLCQSVRSASILKPEAIANDGLEIFILYEKMKCDLSELIQNNDRKRMKFTPDEMKVFLKQITLALEELENKQIAHTNLKPKNILISMEGDYKLVDVGIQSMNEDNDFKAPEAIVKSKSGNINLHKSDVFSLGLILVQMMTLRSSKELGGFKQNGYKLVEEVFEEIRENYGKDMQKIVKDMLDLSDSRRKSMKQMRDDLEAIYNSVNEQKNPFSKNPDNNNSKISIEDKLVKDLFEAIVEKLRKKDQDSSFFLKYNLTSFSKKINRLDFLDSMEALDIKLNQKDVTLLSRVLDNENTGLFDLSQLLEELDNNNSNPKQFRSAYDRLEVMNEVEEKALRTILDDIHTFCRKGNFNYMEICKDKDFYNKGTILYDDLKFIHKQLKLTNLNESDYELIRKKYDKSSNNEINYKLLIADMEAPYKSTSDYLSKNVKEFYARVREIYNTVSEFFQKVDIDGNKVISREEFITLIKNLRLSFSSTDMNAIWVQLDKSNNGKVYPLNFRTLFMPYIDEDLKNMLLDLYRCLDNEGLIFQELIKAYNKSGGYIPFERLLTAIKSINPSFTPRALSFILSEFDIRNIQEINIQSLDKSLSEKARDLNLNIDPKHLKSFPKSPSNKSLSKDSSQSKFYERALNMKKSPGEVLFTKLQEKIQKYKQSDVMKLFKNVDKNNDRLLDLKEFIELVNNFSNDLDQSDKKAMFNFLDVDGDEKVSSVEFFGRIYPTFYEEGPGKDKSFIPEKYEYALKFIQDINYNLGLKKKTAEEHFYSFDTNMPHVDFRFYVSQLGVNIEGNGDRLINSLITPDDPNTVNLQLFFKIVNYFKNNTKKQQVILNKFELSKIFKTINDAMGFQGQNYETIFAKFDRFGQNQISLADFNYAISDLLKLNNLPNLNFFTNYLLEGESISLARLYKGLFEEAHSSKLIQDLKNLVYQNNLNVEKVFQKYDYNENSILEPGEFYNLLKVFDEHLTIEDSQNIFNKFDSNNDGKITLSEFKRGIATDNNNASFDKDFLTQGFFENISILIQENGYSLQQLFGKNTIDGKLPIDYFYTGLQFIGYDKERNSEKVKTVLQVLTQNMERNQINYSLMVTLFERYRKQYNQTNLVISEEEKIRIKGFTRLLKQTIESRKLSFSKVFESRDKFGTGFISSEELKLILLNELYMDQSPDLFLFIKNLNPLNDGKCSLNKLKSEFTDIPNTPHSSSDKTMMTPDQFFQSLLPPFQNNSVNILSFLFENKPSIAKNDFLTKCANLNLFPREQILYIYSKIDTTFAGRIDRQQIEPFFGPHLQRLSYSSQGYPQTPVQQTPNLYGPPPPNTAGGNFYQGNQGNFQGNIPPIQVQGNYPPQNPVFNFPPPQTQGNFQQQQLPQPNYLPPNNPIVQSGYIQDPYQQQSFVNPGDSKLYQTQYINFQGQDMRNPSAVNMNVPPELIKELSSYIQGSRNILLREFNQIDRGMTGYLPIWEIKKIFHNNGYESIRVDDLEQFGIYFGVCDNKNINYNKLLEICDSLATIKNQGNTEYQSSHELEVVNRLREEILRLNLNLPMILQKYDKGNQMIYIREFSSELQTRGINMKKDDLMILLNKVKQNNMNQINYIEISNFIMNNNNRNSPIRPSTPNPGLPSYNSPLNPNTNNPNLNNLFEIVKEKIKNLYVTQGISLRALFRQIDIDCDNYISYKEFSDCLDRKLKMSGLAFNQIEESFKAFDDDRDYKISYFEFSKHILNLGSVDHKKLLLKLKKQLLEKTNEEKDLLKLFKSMDEDGNGFLSFNELKEAVHKFNINFTDTEIEDIFRYFDKDETEKISYDHFVAVLSEDHLNLAPLRKKVNDILKEKNQSIIAFFRSLNANGDDKVLKRKEFGEFLKKLGFNYDPDQEEELFESFDQDKDYLISFEEFNNMILDKKQEDISSLIKRLRRLVFSQKLDLSAQFKALDKRNSGIISFLEFNRVLKKLSDLSPIEIELIFKGFSNGEQNMDYGAFWDALLENNIDLEPIKQKFDELCKRWNVDYEGLFEQFDQANKGYLTWLDFDQMMLALQLRLPIEELQEYFNAFDVNKNGNLTEMEFLEVLRGKKAKNKKMMFNVESPIWKRNSEAMNHDFVYKPGLKEKKGFNLKPIETNFDEDEDTMARPMKLRRMGDDEENNNNLPGMQKGPMKSRNLNSNSNLSGFASKIKPPIEEEEWTADELLETIKRQAYMKNIRLFSAFIEFDRARTCVLSNIRDLGTIIQERLDLRQVQWSDIENLYQHFSPDNGQTMNFVRLLMDIDDPGSVLIEMMTYVMKMEQMGLADVFRKVDKDHDDYWDIKEFSSLNNMLNVGMDREISQIFNQWDLNKDGFISLKDLEKIFNVGQQKTPMHPSNYPSKSQDTNNIRYFQQKYNLSKKFLKYVISNMYEQNVRSPQQLCSTNEEQVPRATFLNSLDKIRVNMQNPEAKDFLTNLSVEGNPKYIDLREFDYLIRNFGEIFNDDTFKKATEYPNQPLNKPMNNDINMIVQELKGYVEEVGFGVFSQYDRNNSGYISEKDLYEIMTKHMELDPCDEIDVFIKYVSQNGRISLSELKKIFGLDEKKRQGFEGIQMQSIGVKSNYQKAKVLNEKERKFLNDGVEELKKAYGRKVDEFIALYFTAKDKSQLNLIDKQKFIETSLYLKSKLTEKDLAYLFTLIDINDSGTITKSEFLLLLGEPDIRVERNKGNVDLPNELTKEIQDLFKEVDTDNSGFVEKNELAQSLMRVGINPTNQEIDEYLAKFDKDGDGKISYGEFKYIFEDKLKSDMMVMDELLGNLRREFKNADIQRNRMLNMTQLYQVFSNLGIDLVKDELEALFNEIDVDKSNTIDIDELIYFMTKNQSNINPLAASALMNIRLSKKLSLADFKDVFKNMPSNFTLSFLRIANKKLKNLPSSLLKPKVDSSGLFYENLELFNNVKSDEESLLKRIEPKFLFEIKFIAANGVPIPSEKNIKREKSIFHREVKIALFDQTHNKFISNTVNVTATWTPNYEDRWNFQRNIPNIESSIFVKIQDYEENKFKNVTIIFEFVIYFLKGNQLMEISCGYASLDVIHINSKSTKLKLNLEGGAPFKKITIRKDDVQVNRTGWRKVVQKITKNIASQLELEIVPIERNSRNMNDLKALPPFILVNKSATSMLRYFREYIARRATINGGLDPNLGGDVKVKTFLRCMDCPDTFEKMYKFWNDTIMPKAPNSMLKVIDYMSKIIDQFYIMFAKADFKFNSSDPTAMTVGTPLNNTRNDMITNALEEILVVIGMKQGIGPRKNNENTNIEPIMLNDAGSDSDEENFLSQLKKKAKKHTMERGGYSNQMKQHHQFGSGFSGNEPFSKSKGFSGGGGSFERGPGFD